MLEGILGFKLNHHLKGLLRACQYLHFGWKATTECSVPNIQNLPQNEVLHKKAHLSLGW